MTDSHPPLLNTREVADYLRIKERKVYDLVAAKKIPCTRAAGKWLFPKELIDLWLYSQIEGLPASAAPQPPAILTGSHDPLLDWAVRESGCGLAVLFNGSLDGVERFARREAQLCGLHVLDASGEYNTPLLRRRLAGASAVAVEWAKRDQGLIVARDNPLGIHTPADLRGKRVAGRQKEAGSRILLDHLLDRAELNEQDLQLHQPPLRSETDIALAVANDEADAGLGIAAVARQFRLGFVPLLQERYDLIVWRRQYFEPPLQTLLAFSRSEQFRARAAELSGYDIDTLGAVRFNG